MIESVIFDLDGTLVKSHKTIYMATVSTLEKMNLSTQFDKNMFYSLLGHHFNDIFRGCGINVPNMSEFISIYKKYYKDFLDLSVIYPNTFETLEILKEMKIKLALLTTKSHEQAKSLSEYFELDRYLDIVVGRKKDIPHKPAPDQYLSICNNLNVLPENSMMVGDTELDVLCAKNAGASSCAVEYGYRTIDELNQYSPDYIIKNLLEVINLVELN